MAGTSAKGKGVEREYTTILNVRVPVELAERIDRVAGDRGQNRSDYIRDVLERAVARVERAATAVA